MHIWTYLAAREAALLLILLLLGAGPASFLSPRFGAATRIALAPVLGFCLGTCVTTTLLEFAPTESTGWLLVPLALVSAGVAVMRTVRTPRAGPWHRRLPLADVLALVLVGVVVAGPVSFVLHERHTVGPAVYYYTDVDNYVAVQDAARTVDLHDARTAWQRKFAGGARVGNQTQYIWSYIAEAGSNLDATSLDANANALLGLGANDTYSPFLTVLLLSGALGAFAAVRYFSRAGPWAAALAGCLFGGPLFLELWFDSYQAAIVAISLLIPVIMLVDDGLVVPRPATAVLVAVILAAMLSVYPLYMALLVGAFALMVLARALEHHRAGRSLRPLVRPALLTVAAVAAMTVLFNLVGFTRDIRYYQEVLNGTIALPRVGYKLPLSVLPGWIGQTREFWDMPALGGASLKQLLLGGALPLLLLAIAVLGVRRYRASLSLVALAGICAIAAEYTFVSQQSCTYCAERNLLPLGPIAAVLIALGIGAIFGAPGRVGKLAAVVAAGVVVLAVGQRARVELMRFAGSSYFLESADRSMLAQAPRGADPIEEEGFNASVFAQAEQPLVYHLVTERRHRPPSVILGSNLGNAIQYLDFGPVKLPSSPAFDPDYTYVLTRLPGIATDRRVIARSGAVALEQRTAPLDVTPYAGVGVPFARVDPSGTAWVQSVYPLQLLVAGRSGGRPVWARLVFSADVPVSVPPQPGVTSRLSGHTLTACVRATGPEPTRLAAIRISAGVRPGPPPPGLFAPAMPLEGLALTGMYAVAGHCTA